jgi:hypothetical protein
VFKAHFSSQCFSSHRPQTASFFVSPPKSEFTAVFEYSKNLSAFLQL